MADRLRKITIRKKLMQELIDTVAEVYETTNEIKTTAMELSLLQGKVKKLHDYLWDSISVRDTAVRTNMKENFYHGMLLGLLRSQESWLVKSNAETGEGYSDISIQTPDRIGIVIEIKYADDGDLEAGCSEALLQIEEKKYAEGLKRRGMKNIIKYGIAFCGKECMISVDISKNRRRC